MEAIIVEYEKQIRILKPSWSNADIRSWAVNMYYLGWELPK